MTDQTANLFRLGMECSHIDSGARIIKATKYLQNVLTAATSEGAAMSTTLAAQPLAPEVDVPVDNGDCGGIQKLCDVEGMVAALEEKPAPVYEYPWEQEDPPWAGCRPEDAPAWP